MKTSDSVMLIAFCCLCIFIYTGCKKDLPPEKSVIITESDGNTTTSEDGATDNYTLKLATQPAANVTIYLAVDNQITVTPAQITFSDSTWDIPQTITVSAIDDEIPEGAHQGIITHSAKSMDADYDNIIVSPVVVNIEENEFSLIISGSRTGHFAVVDPVTGQDIAECAPAVNYVGETCLGYMGRKAVLISPVVPAGNPVIFTCDPFTGENPVQLLSDNEFYVLNIDGSPVEPRIVFSAKDPLESKHHVYTINEDGSSLTRLTQDEELIECPGRVLTKLMGADRPAWSPDGNRIAFVAFLSETETNYAHNAIVVMQATGENKEVVYDMPDVAEAHYDDICWSKDGEFILFGVSEDGIDKVKTLHVSTRKTTEIQQYMIVGSLGKESHWTDPLQQKILFNLHSPGGSDLYTIDYKTSGSSFTITSSPKKLTDGKAVGHSYQEADWQEWDGEMK